MILKWLKISKLLIKHFFKRKKFPTIMFETISHQGDGFREFGQESFFFMDTKR